MRFFFDNARWLCAGLLLTLFSGFGQTFFIALSNDAFKARFGLSDGDLGLIYGLATLTSALILVEFGRILDRISARRTAVMIICGLAVAAVMAGWAGNIVMLFFGYLGLRLFGQGMMGHTAMTATGRWFAARRGRAVSIVALGHPLSEIVFPPVMVALIVWFTVGWAWSMVALALIVIALPLAIWLFAVDRTPERPGEVSKGIVKPAVRSWRRAELLKLPAFYFLLIGVLTPPFVNTAVFFHQQHLAAVKGWDMGLFALGVSVFGICQIIASLRAGGMIDRMSAHAILPLYLLPLAAGVMVGAVYREPWAIFVMLGLMGLSNGTAATLMGAIWPELFGTRYLGEIRALTFAFMVASTAAAPYLTGMLIDGGIAFTDQMLVMVGYALLASGLMALIQPRLNAIAHDGAASPDTEQDQT